jgi:lipopolysaccharide transport system permease protein
MTDRSSAAGRRLRIDSRRRPFPDLREAFRARQLLALLSRRDITVRYRQTVLGSLWILAGPLLSAGLFTFVFGRVAKLSSGGDPYFAFSYAGLLAWTLFSGTLTGASSSLTSNSSLLTKIYFPRLILPLSTVASSLINTAISFVVMMALLVIYHIGFSVHLLLLPAWLLLAMTFAMGLGLILTSLAVSYRDINQITPILTSLLLYVTPVAYSSGNVPRDLRTLYLLNPVANIVEGCRWSLLGRAELHAWAVGYTVVVAVAALLVGLTLFARLERTFADVV